MSDNLARILTEAAEQNADGIAIKLDDTEVSYGALERGQRPDGGASSRRRGCRPATASA